MLDGRGVIGVDEVVREVDSLRRRVDVIIRILVVEAVVVEGMEVEDTVALEAIFVDMAGEEEVVEDARIGLE